jgi:glycosyltransferase involved in cell wall biosynthesis
MISALKRNAVVEGSEGEMEKDNHDKGAFYRRANILVVCQYYYPENFQITPICEALATDGYKVTVLTGLPNYPAGIVPREYRHGHRKEYRNGVHIVRCYEFGRKKGPVCLAVNYASFAATAWKKAGELKEDYDIVFCYQLSPIFMGLPARRYAQKHKVPFLLYCCDIWPESVKLYIRNERNVLFKATKVISKIIYSFADRIVVQSTSFIDYLERTHNIDREKIRYIPAFAEETYVLTDFTPNDETTDFVFLGNLGIAQDLMSVIKAVKAIAYIPNFKVHFVGDGACLDEMKEYVKAAQLEDIVFFYGRQPTEDMPKYYQLADVCLVSLKADNAIGLTLPTKLQGYMAAGKPVIAMIDGSARDVIQESGCGICVKPGDTEALSHAMRDFIEHKEKYSDCGKKGRDYFKANFAKERCMRELEFVIDELLEARSEKDNVGI